MMSKEIKIQKHTLLNGLDILMIPSKQAPVVALQGWIRFGAADESDDIAGVAHLFEHLLFKGTQKRKVGQIANEIEGLGGDLNAYTTYDHTVMHMTLPSKHLDLGLDILADSLQNSQVEESELANERPVILEEIKRRNDMPGSLASDLLRGALFKGHPYARPVIGYDSVVEKISREKILELYHKNYVSNKMFIVVAGDFDEAHVLKISADLFRNLKPGVPSQNRNLAQQLNGKEEHFKNHPTSPDALIQIGWLGPKASDSSVAALDAFCLILGQGESSRLTKKIVHEKSLVRDIGSSLWTPRDAGSFVIGIKDTAGIAKKLPDILGYIQDEIEKPISELELEKAKKNLLSQAIYSKETVDGLAERFGYYESIVGDHKYDFHYLDQVNELSVNDVEEARNKLIDWNKSVIGGIVPAKDKLPSFEIKKPKKEQSQLLKDPKSQKPTTLVEKAKVGQLTVLLRPLTNLPVFSLRWVGIGGSRIEPENKNGLGNLWARTVTQSALGLDGKVWSREKINEVFDLSSAGLSSFHGRNSWGYQLDGLSDDFEKLFEITMATIFRPTFDAQVFKLEKEHLLQDIKSSRDRPATVVNEIFSKALFGKHPMGRSPIGDTKIVSKLKRTDLEKYHQVQITKPQVLSVAGDISMSRILHVIQGLESKFKYQPLSPLLKVKAPKAPKKGVELRSTLKKEQTHILMGVQTCPMKHKDRWALIGLSAVLSGQGGRLFIELRDKMSLCYTVAPTSTSTLDGGGFGFYIATSPEKETTAREALAKEIRRLRDEGLEDEEWQKAKSFYLGNHLIDQQRFATQATGIALDELYGNGFEEYFEFENQFGKLSAKDIVTVVKKYFSEKALKNAVTAVVGPSTH
jgi:zinc protease